MSGLADLPFGSAARFGDRPALGMRRGLRTEVWSYADLAKRVRTAAARIQGAGVGPGDRVLCIAPNSPELVASMFGVWQAGGVLVPIDLRTPEEVIERIGRQTEPRLMISSESAVELAGLAALSPCELAASAGASERIGSTSDPRHPLTDARQPTSDLAEIVFTSGTTGSPKGVMLSHANVLANVRSALEAMPMPAGERLLSLLPLSHMMEQTVGLLAALAAGATIYYPTSRRSTAVVTALQRHRIGLLVCVPEILRLLLGGIEREFKRRSGERSWRLLGEVAERLPMQLRSVLFGPVHRRLGGRLRVVLCGGAVLDPELGRGWERLGIRVVQGYGATECAPIVTSNRVNQRLPGSVGWPVSGVRLRLAPEGEVLVRGPNVSRGYWRDKAATAAAFDGSWYRTRDVGELGPRGELRLMGRKEEMIVLPDGRNVFPQDIEAELKSEPPIKDCVVVGKPRAGGGEELHAVLLPTDGIQAAAAAVRQASLRLAPHQRPSGFSVWPEADFPRTPSLKVKRADVRAALDGHPHTEEVAAPPMPAGDCLEARLCTLLARATPRTWARIHLDADLTLDLGIDSLGRVELAVMLEEEFGCSVSDEEMANLRTVSDLVTVLKRGGSASVASPLPAWPRQPLARLLRSSLQELLLLPVLQLLCRPRRVFGIDRLRLTGPVLLIANHTSHLDGLAILSILPPALRRRTAVGAAADYFFQSQPLAGFAALALGAFPFNRQGAVATSLAHCGDLADDGYSILIFPEGTRSPDGRLRPFKSGIGLLARELGMPVVPIHLAGLHAVLPKGHSWPRRGPLEARVGEPMWLDSRLSNREATATLEAAMGHLAETPARGHHRAQ
jgi:long-chain acyl-CoA synthetase